MPSDRAERIGLFANWDLRRGPQSALIRFVRTFEPYWREVSRPEIYAIEGSYRALLRHGLLHDYPRLHALPAGRNGGIVNLANRVVRKGFEPDSAFGIDRVIYFIDPRDPTSLFPDSQALKRECVVTGTTFLATHAAANEWYALQWCAATLGQDDDAARLREQHYLSAELLEQLFPDLPQGPAGQTLALIAHDTRKSAMLEFAGEHFEFLHRFRRRLATGTTGTLLNGEIPERLGEQWAAVNEEVAIFQSVGRVPARLATARAEQRRSADMCRAMAERLGDSGHWVEPQPSGPRGGDIQIADMVREGDCQSVVFFEDPHVSREHEADIQLLERTTRIPECEVMCLHEPQSAREWATNWQRCLEAGVPPPVSVIDAFRRIWGVELVLADLGRDSVGEAAQQQAVWRDVVDKAAWYVHGLIAERARERLQQGERARIGVTWGIEMHEFLDTLEQIPRRLAALDRHHTKLSRGIAGAAVRSLHNSQVGPLIGIMGTTDPRNEANHNARRLAEQLSAGILSLAQFAFCEQRYQTSNGDRQRQELERHWAQLDVALLSCDRVKRHFSSRTALPLPEPLHQQLASATVAEISGIYLKHQGDEATPRDFQRVGAALEDLRGVAARRGAVLIAGAQPERVDSALAALRAGIVSTLVTNLGFAHGILRLQAGGNG